MSLLPSLGAEVATVERCFSGGLLRRTLCRQESDSGVQSWTTGLVAAGKRYSALPTDVVADRTLAEPCSMYVYCTQDRNWALKL